MISERGRRAVPAVAYGCAAVFMGGLFVASTQAYIVFERLMVGADFRSGTVLETALFWAFVGALATGTLAHLLLARRSASASWGASLAWSVFVAVALWCWYVLARAQWWLVVSQGTGPGMAWDTTPLDEALLVAAVIASVVAGVIVLRALRARRASAG